MSTAEPPRSLRRPTITDVAAAAGVSVATVSKVINQRYGVSPATAQRVLAVIAELGYESSLVASSLRRSRTGVIGVLVNEFEPYSTELLKGISASLAGSGYELLAHSHGGLSDVNDGWERRSLSRLARTLIDGAIVVTPSTLITDQAGIPVVAIDPHTGPDGPPTVDADNVPGARSAVDHLVSLGHRRIGYLGGRPDLRSAQLREQGFREGLAAAGLAAEPELMRVAGYQPALAEPSARELLTLPDDRRPTAIFAANDLSAIKVLQVATELGLRVPEDLSVIGFDNVPDAANSSLTTVAQPLGAMGAAALGLLMDGLAGKTVDQHLRLPTELVIRSSTAPPA